MGINKFGVRIRGYHTDAYGHVNNARYLEFLEEARWSYFEATDLLTYLSDIMMVVTHIDIHYRQSIKLDSLVEIETKVLDVNHKQLKLSQLIRLKDSEKSAVKAVVTLVSVSRESGVIKSFSDQMYQILKKC